MTSEEAVDVVKKSDAKKADACKLTEEAERKDKPSDEKQKRSHELMRLVYEVPEEIKKSELINNNMLKENPPITLVEITEHNGCEKELGNASDNGVYIKVGSPENLGNKVVYDVLDTNEMIMHCGEEYKEVIDRASPDDSTDEDLLELKRILEAKPKVLDRYLRECASVDEVNRIHSVTSSGPLSPRPHHEARSTSVTSDLFQLWLTSSPIKVRLFNAPLKKLPLDDSVKD